MKHSIVQRNSMDGQLGQKTVLRDTMGRPLMSYIYIYPLGTEGWDGQVGQHHALSHMSLRIEGWDGHRVMLKRRDTP